MPRSVRMSQAQVKVLQHRLDGEAPDDVTQKKRRDNEEEREQILLFNRRDQLVSLYPDLAWMYATLNGVFIPPALLKRVKDAGLTPGVLDVWLLCFREDESGQWVGLALDMKKKRNGRPSPEQKLWAARAMECRFRAYFPAGAVDAWRIIASYIGITGAHHMALEMERQSDFMDRVSGK